MTVVAEIERCLYWQNVQSCSVVVPRLTPRDWWEMDMCAITKNGFAREFEIKTSISDFRNDFKKTDRSYDFSNRRFKHDTKHGRLSEARCYPTYFWFVCPEGVIPETEIPDYAGLQYFYTRGSRGLLHTVKPAPRLHKRGVGKIPDAGISYAMSILSHRFWPLYWSHIDYKSKHEVEDSPTEKLRKRCRKRSTKLAQLWSLMRQARDTINEYFGPADDSFSWRTPDADRRWCRKAVTELRSLRKKHASLTQLQEKDEARMIDLETDMWEDD